MTKIIRVGPMFLGKTHPVGEDKHLFHGRGLKGRLLFNCFSHIDSQLEVFFLELAEFWTSGLAIC